MQWKRKCLTVSGFMSQLHGSDLICLISSRYLLKCYFSVRNCIRTETHWPPGAKPLTLLPNTKSRYEYTDPLLVIRCDPIQFGMANLVLDLVWVNHRQYLAGGGPGGGRGKAPAEYGFPS